jgi:hypothetical protein
MSTIRSDKIQSFPVSLQSAIPLSEASGDAG